MLIRSLNMTTMVMVYLLCILTTVSAVRPKIDPKITDEENIAAARKAYTSFAGENFFYTSKLVEYLQTERSVARISPDCATDIWKLIEGLLGGTDPTALAGMSLLLLYHLICLYIESIFLYAFCLHRI